MGVWVSSPTMNAEDVNLGPVITTAQKNATVVQRQKTEFYNTPLHLMALTVSVLRG